MSLFGKIVNGHVSRSFFKGLSDYCITDKKNRVEIALELYIDKRKSACWKCKLAKKIIAPILNINITLLDFTLNRRITNDTFLEKCKKQPHLIKNLSVIVKGLADFGLNKPFVPAAPFQVVWEITQECNLKCKHCSVNAGINFEKELTTEKAFEVIDKLDKFGIPVLSFSGGEALLRDDIFELFRYTSEKGILVGVDTNGVLITKDNARKMKEVGVEYIRISLDSTKPETHDSFRGAKGTFNKTIDGIKNAVAEEISVYVCTTVIKQNLNEILDMIKLCQELKVDRFILGNFIPVGRGKDVASKYDIKPEKREKLLESIYKIMTNSTIDISLGYPEIIRVASKVDGCEKIIPTYWSNIKQRNGAKTLAEYQGGCTAGRFTILIKSNGDIHPCSFIPLKVGNILEDDLNFIWKHNEILKNFRNRSLLKFGCKNCEYSYSCGGCRAQAFSRLNDYFLPDTTCINNKNYLT